MEFKNIKQLEKEIKKKLKGCGDKATTGGICGNLSRDKQLVFNKSLTDSKFEKTKVFCLECWKEIFMLQGKLQTLQEVCEEIEEYCDSLIDTKGEKGKITLLQFRQELLKKFQGEEK